MPHHLGWFWRTRWGVFRVAPTADGRFQAMLGDEGLGSYPTPQMAVDDLCGDHCFSNSLGVDTSRCGLPVDLGDWEVLLR